MLHLNGDNVTGIDPGKLSEEMNEATFERYLVQDPSVLGEELLLLGRQLSEFKEDSKRLDLLAVDKAGELVLVELKVDGGAEFTELQAIGYAGAYSRSDTRELAKTLCAALNADHGSSRWLPRPDGLVGPATQSSVEDLITEFLEEDTFEGWTPSEKVRIKIVGPGFPRRVVASVRWLIEIHKLDIEVLEVKPFKQPDGSLSLVFERLLPVPGDEQLGLTRRKEAEEQQQKNETKAKNKYVLPLLIENGDLAPGDVIIISKAALPKDLRNEWDPTKPLFRAIIDQDSKKKVLWRPDEDHDWKLTSPARMANLIEEFMTNEEVEPYAHAVGSMFTKGEDGPFLDQIAIEQGLWSY